MTYSEMSMSNAETKGGRVGNGNGNLNPITKSNVNPQCELIPQIGGQSKELLQGQGTVVAQVEQSSSSEKVYGYIDLFKNMGDQVPLEMFPISQSKVTIGRDHNCQIVIDNARVSRQQCAILILTDNAGRNFQVRLQNLTSRLTTIHRNTGIVKPGEEVPLIHGDRFRLYDIELRYRLYDPVNEKGQLDWSKPIPHARVTQAMDKNMPEPQLQKAKLSFQNQSQSQIPIIKITRPVVDKAPQNQNQIQSQQQPDELPENSMSKSKLAVMIPGRDHRRQSSPLPITSEQKSKLDLLRLPRWSSMKMLHVRSNSVPNNFRTSNHQSQSQNPSSLSPNNQNNRNNHRNSIEDLRNSRNLNQNQNGFQNSNNNNSLSPNKNVTMSNNNGRSKGQSQNQLQVDRPITYKRRGSSDFDMRKAVLQRSFRRAFKEKLSQGTLVDVDLNNARYRRAVEDFIVLSSAA